MTPAFRKKGILSMSEMNENVEGQIMESKEEKQKTTKPAKRVPKSKAQTRPSVVIKDVDPDQYVTVRNGFQGRLVYKSKKTGEIFVWDGFGSEQEMELRELKNAKNSYKKFFENNWFMFDEDWIVDYLGVRKFYKNAIRIDEFDSVFEKDAASIKKDISMLSLGQKKSLAYRARILIADGKIDSNRVITALEESLGVELIER